MSSRLVNPEGQDPWDMNTIQMDDYPVTDFAFSDEFGFDFTQYSYNPSPSSGMVTEPTPFNPFVSWETLMRDMLQFQSTPDPGQSMDAANLSSGHLSPSNFTG